MAASSRSIGLTSASGSPPVRSTNAAKGHGLCRLESVHHRLRVRPGAIVAHVADDADHLDHRRPRIRAQADACAKRVALRPVAARHALADHDRRRRAQAIARVEGASLPERDAQRAEVVVRDRRPQDEGRRLVRPLRRTVDAEARAVGDRGVSS